MLHKSKTYTHTPDCSSIPDQELKKAIYGRWPSTTINYSFSRLPYYTHYFEGSSSGLLYGNIPKRLDLQLKNVKPIIESSLDEWRKASNNTLQFLEQSYTHLYSPGIYFIFLDDKELDSIDASGVTETFIDENNYFNQVFVQLPYNEKYWKGLKISNYLRSTISHEIGHALGFDHLHQFPEITKKLKGTYEGLFCSILPYPEKITSNISQCQSNCDPDYAISPGYLDKRLVSLAYHPNFIPAENNIDSPYIIHPFFRAHPLLTFLIANGFLTSFCIEISKQTSINFIENLRINHHKKIFSTQMAELITDSVMTIILNHLEMPIWIIQLLIASIIIEHLINHRIKPTSYIRNIAITAHFSHEMFPATLGALFSVLGTYLGKNCQNPGNFLAKMINFIPQTITTSNKIHKEKSSKIELCNNRNMLFNATRPRSSVCVKLMSWLGFKRTQENFYQEKIIDIEEGKTNNIIPMTRKKHKSSIPQL